ncbi:hypothetical protein GNI_137730 [Gregarina niphandrodes]|uniref:Uncharacterized protein n=1 Tax=Gregarina niphandrodes TaxID=110365 RepID=A0A023B0Q4_GRENI|nr:hypothetical protein GNI_137730 [Gregarina niphandrodes]EZG45627.1 hypothetical protein GNI_137730 [Gregarina niphandrodes]|eukprot:XP_011132469.1 hypothetical protein GNI_137730 [Gregarina niphandrodes]
MSSSVSVPSGVSDYRNESGSENVNKSTTMVPGEVVIREVAMLCNLGLGHINPSLQFHTCLCAHGYTSTLFAPVNRVQRDEMTKRAKTIIKLERLVEYCQRLMPCPDEVPQALEAKSVMEGEPEANGALGDKVEEILALEMGPGLTLVLIEVKAAVIEELIDIYSDLHWQYNLWYKIVVEYYEGVHSNRGKVRPIAVFGDFMTVADVPVAEFFEAQCWTFCPSPCIVIGAFDNFFLSVAKAEEMKQVELPGLGSYKPDQLIRLKGIPALEKCTKLMLQLYHQRGAKKGFVCNDVDAFYRPELLSNIKQSITGLLNVGPVIGYDARIGRGLVDGDSDLEWLNQFADESVLFIAFGTVFSPSAEDMKAICTAIDKTPNYVLWSVRSPHKGVEGFSERGFPTSFEGKRARIVNWIQPRPSY